MPTIEWTDERRRSIGPLLIEESRSEFHSVVCRVVFAGQPPLGTILEACSLSVALWLSIIVSVKLHSFMA